MNLIIVPIIWTSNEYIFNPDSVTLQFTDQEIEKLKLCINLASQHDITVSLDICAENNLEDTTDFTPGYECIRIYSTGILYYYAQSKYDASIQIESEAFTIDTIINTSVNADNKAEN